MTDPTILAPNHERHDVISRALRENYASITQQVTMLPPSTGLSRETNDNFQELCNTFSDGILSRNPRELTLFGFPSLYSKKWKLTGVKQVPQFNC